MLRLFAYFLWEPSKGSDLDFSLPADTFQGL